MVAEATTDDFEDETETKSIFTKSRGDQGTDPSAMAGDAPESTESSVEPTAASGNAPSSGQSSSTSAGQTAAAGQAPSAEQNSNSQSTSTQTAAGQENSSSNLPASATTSSAVAGANADAAASSSSAATLSSSANQGSANKTDAGALAGGIVGAFFGGAILALMAAYFLNRRRKSPPYQDRSSKAIESAHGASTKKSLRPPPTVTNAWERLVPQPVDDETMGSLVKSLLDRVALHVDNFYARKAVQLSTSDLEFFAKVDTKLLPSPLSEMMMDPAMQTLAIKHCIAFAMTDSITPADDPSNKLLPIYLAALPRKLASDPKNEVDLKAERQAYAVLRSIQNCLLPKLADDPMLADHRRQVTTNMINDLSAAFRNWEVSSSDNGERAAQNLAEIVGVAFDVGMRISSQACTFGFEKHHRRRRSEETESFVVLPGFNKVVDERGNLIGGPQVLVRPTTYRPRRDR